MAFDGSETWTHCLAVSGVRRQWSTGMREGTYMRVTIRTNADGSLVRHVALAHNERVDGHRRGSTACKSLDGRPTGRASQTRVDTVVDPGLL